VARLIRRIDPSIGITGVEPDRAVRRFASRLFGTGDLKVSLVPTDAESFLSQPGERFDALLDDIYAPRNGRLARPLDAATLPALARRRLKPGGLYAANLISPGGVVERATIDSALSAYRHLALVYTRHYAHKILLASDRPFPRGSVLRELKRLLRMRRATLAGLAIGPVRRFDGRIRSNREMRET
jgi:spermidine synthase